MEGNAMNACIKIWFYTPTQYAAMLAVILAMGAGLLALIVIC
jgi:hypothetical protein